MALDQLHDQSFLKRGDTTGRRLVGMTLYETRKREEEENDKLTNKPQPCT